jgi:flagellar protein FliS
MLYEGAIRFVQQAHEAVIQGDAQARHDKLRRAGDIVSALQSALDLDQGGALAKGLFDFYGAIGMRLLSLHRTPSPSAYSAVAEELRSMRDMWDAIDREKSA